MSSQDRKDASHEWGVQIDEVIFNKLHLLPNCVDQCIYQEVVQENVAVLAQTTDYIVIASKSVKWYKEEVCVLTSHWKVATQVI